MRPGKAILQRLRPWRPIWGLICHSNEGDPAVFRRCGRFGGALLLARCEGSRQQRARARPPREKRRPTPRSSRGAGPQSQALPPRGTRRLRARASRGAGPQCLTPHPLERGRLRALASRGAGLRSHHCFPKATSRGAGRRSRRSRSSTPRQPSRRWPSGPRRGSSVGWTRRSSGACGPKGSLRRRGAGRPARRDRPPRPCPWRPSKGGTRIC